jgi:thiosulfate dehydrogenase [quinone] large subunit
MSDQSTPSTQSNNISNEEWAFLGLRLFLAIRWLFAGLDKFGSVGNYSFENYYNKMSGMAGGIAEASIIPGWAAKLFALPMGYIMLILSVTILLGIKLRISLIVSLLLYVGLSVGLMAVDEQHGIAWIGIHLIISVMALKMVTNAKWVVLKD